MSSLQTFMDRCLAGTTPLDAIDDYVGMWHDEAAGAGLPLHAFLGMDEREYALWLRDPESLHDIVKSRQQLASTGGRG